jgi:hypothetical protein
MFFFGKAISFSLLSVTPRWSSGGCCFPQAAQAELTLRNTGFISPALYSLGLSYPSPHQEFSLHLLKQQFVQEGCNLPASCVGLWFLPEQMMWSAHLEGLLFLFVVLGVGSLGNKQMAVRGSVSMNFGGSRTTQMLSEVFCSSLH